MVDCATSDSVATLLSPYVTPTIQFLTLVSKVLMLSGVFMLMHYYRIAVLDKSRGKENNEMMKRGENEENEKLLILLLLLESWNNQMQQLMHRNRGVHKS